MIDPESFDGPDPHLSERLERAVDGLRAPDVGPIAMARGRRQRTHRRLVYAAGSIAAATALVLTVPAFAGGWPGRGEDPSGPPTAADPAASSPTSASPTAAAPRSDGSEDNPCGATPAGWWSKPSAEVRADLAALLPEGVRIGQTDEDWTGTWGGNLVTGQDEDFALVDLLPPPTPRSGPYETADGRLMCGDNKPLQAVKPCGELTRHVACEEIRSEDGVLVGVITESVETDIVDGREQPTGKAYLLATVIGPDGGHVELYVGEGTRADRPDTVHDPDDVPALTMSQVRAIVTDPVWTS